MEEPRKTSRASSHKTRTGCITCKRRHVKCDEARPHCSKCRDGNRACEGYTAPAAKTRRARVPSTMQVCWNSKSTMSARRTTSGSSSPIPSESKLLQEARLIPTTPDFKDNKARQYFGEFVSLVRGPWITASAASGADLWDVILPQLAHSNVTIQHAAMAIGAISLWRRQSRLSGEERHVSSTSNPLLLKTDSTPAETHLLSGIDYYCQSLKLQSRNDSLQDALLLSVLLLTFETLRGDRQAALQHVNHGLTLLLAIATDQSGRLDALAPDPKPILKSVASVFICLVPSARSILHGRIGQCQPLPNFARALRAQQQTLHSFKELVNQRPHAYTATAAKNIPEAFGTLEEFEEHWSAALHRQQAMETMLVETVQTSGVLETTSLSENEDFWVRLLEDPNIRKFCVETQSIMEAIALASDSLFKKTIMSEQVGSRSYLRAIHLRLQYFSIHIFADPAKILDYEVLQARTPLFREYLSLVDLALHAVKKGIDDAPAHHLSFHCDISWYVFVIAIFCREPFVRDEALCKLRDYPGYDGLWDARSLYVLARRNRDVELANLEGTPLQQWRRLWRREYVFEDGGARVIFRYLEKDHAGEWQLVEEVANIQADSDDVDWTRQPLTNDGKLLMGHTVSF